jgi:hypothetical protein
MTIDTAAIRAQAKDYRGRYERGEMTTLAYDICGQSVPALCDALDAERERVKVLRAAYKRYAAACHVCDHCILPEKWLDSSHPDYPKQHDEYNERYKLAHRERLAAQSDIMAQVAALAATDDGGGAG